ncbi:unnamed protein product [Pylaiella littoralis]
MPRPMQPFHFPSRQAPAILRQNGSGRTTLRLDLASAGVTTAGSGSSNRSSNGGGSGGGGRAAATAPASAPAPASGSAQSSARGGGGSSGNRGSHSDGGGLRGRRGWWGSTRRRTPSFIDFWRQAEGRGNGIGAAADQRRRRRNRRRRSRLSQSLFFSPELAIFVLGLAALLAFIVFISDLISGKTFRPMAVLVFVAAGTYCIAIIKQQRVLTMDEQALVIEITDGSSTGTSRRRVISKEERRTLFEYFTFRSSTTAPTTATAATATAAVADSAEQVDDAAAAAAAAVADVSERGKGKEYTFAHGEDRGPMMSGEGGSRGGGWGSPAAAGLLATPHEPVVVTPPPLVDGGCCPAPPTASGLSRPLAVVSSTAAAAVAEGLLEREGDVGEGTGGGAGAANAGAAADRGLLVTHNLSLAPVHRDEAVVALASSSGASAEWASVASAVGTYGGPSSKPVPDCEQQRAEETKEQEVSERETASKGRGHSEEWTTAGSCIVCFGDYADGDDLCRLPCGHTYHAECIDAWLDGLDHAWCPLCKSDLLPQVESRHNSTTAGNSNSNSSSSNNREEGRRGPPVAGNANAAAVTGDEAV